MSASSLDTIEDRVLINNLLFVYVYILLPVVSTLCVLWFIGYTVVDKLISNLMLITQGKIILGNALYQVYPSFLSSVCVSAYFTRLLYS